MGAAEKLSSLHRTRQENLKRVIKDQFAGNASECARAVARSHTFMWQLVDGYRGIGEKSARHIESMLELAPNALDASQRSRTVMVKTVPMVSLEKLDLKSKVFVPCPRQCSVKTFAAVVEHRDVAELFVGDHIFFDRGDVKPLIAEKLYVVQPKGRSPCVLMSVKSSGAWRFTSTHGVRASYSDVRVIGRVLVIVREMAKL